MNKMKEYIRIIFVNVCWVVLLTFATDTKAYITTGNVENSSDKLCIGQSVQVYALDQKAIKITGMTICEDLSGNFLYIMDGNSKTILKYSVNSINGHLSYVESISIRRGRLKDPRGLANSKEASGDVFYFLDYYNDRNNAISRLYRYDVGNKDLTFIDLTDEEYDIGTKEVYGVTRQGDHLMISFDPSGYACQIVRMRRGILKLSVKDDANDQVLRGEKGYQKPSGWEKALNGKPVIIKHMPGPGKTIDENQVEASRSLASMSIDGMNYIWGTVGTENIYLLDGVTGRGIFFFDMPKSPEVAEIHHSGMAFGVGDLWVAVPNSKDPVIHRINVLKNPELPYTGPKRYREIRMRLVSVIKDKVDIPRGYVFHTFLHPFPNEVLGRQGIIPNTIHTNDLNNVADCNIEHLYYFPADDSTSRQDYTLVTYNADLHPDIRRYKTDFSIRVWMREYKHFIYPHLVHGDRGPEGTSYLEDDDVLYRINADPEIYPAFIQRVKDYIIDEYGIDPQMDNPYWAARNITEYVMENYHYPKDDEGYYATYDFEKGNYNSNPGNLKAELSADNNYEDNIIACSGTGAMVCGALRSIGVPATWIGVSQEHNWTSWGTEDGDEFLEFNEESSVGNGHRYNHVWLGEFYKWQRFDATPKRPDGVDFDKKPKEISQWDLMLRSASGVEAHRVIHTIQSEFWPNLHNAFADCEEHVNSCGATRYNLLGTYTYPEDFHLSRNIIRYRAIQFINDVKIELNEELAGVVSWKTVGEWDMDPDAELDVVLERRCKSEHGRNPSGYEIVKVLVRNVPIEQKSVKVNLKGLDPNIYRIKVTKVGDPVTGNACTFEVK